MSSAALCMQLLIAPLPLFSCCPISLCLDNTPGVNVQHSVFVNQSNPALRWFFFLMGFLMYSPLITELLNPQCLKACWYQTKSAFNSFQSSVHCNLSHIQKDRGLCYIWSSELWNFDWDFFFYFYFLHWVLA